MYPVSGRRPAQPRRQGHICGTPPPDADRFEIDNPDHVEFVISNAFANGWFRKSPRGFTDVIVSQVRETSRKPDELYEIIESLCPTGRKVELFGRVNNLRKGWLTIGNQLDGSEVHEHELVHALAAQNKEKDSIPEDLGIVHT